MFLVTLFIQRYKRSPKINMCQHVLTEIQTLFRYFLLSLRHWCPTLQTSFSQKYQILAPQRIDSGYSKQIKNIGDRLFIWNGGRIFSRSKLKISVNFASECIHSNVYSSTTKKSKLSKSFSPLYKIPNFYFEN